MKYIIRTRNSTGRKVYVKIDKAKSKAYECLVYAGFTRDKNVAYHYSNREEAQDALRKFKVAYDHMSFSIEEHLPHVTNEGLQTEPAENVLVATIRALKLFPDVDFEHLKWADYFYRSMDIFDVHELSKQTRKKTTYTITVPVGTGEVHILDAEGRCLFWSTFM